MNAGPPVDLVPLDPWDELFHSVHDQYEAAGAGVAVLHLCGCIDGAPLRAALASLQTRHPKLRSRIVDSSGGRHAFEVARDPPPIRCELKDIGAGDMPWREESSRSLAAGLDPAVGQLARVVVLRPPARDRCALILTAHHALGDGRSLLRVISDLLDYYADAERGGAAPVSSLSIPIAPRARPTGRAWQRALQVAGLIRRRRENRKADWTWLPQEAGEGLLRLWEHVVLTEQETATLALRCRREKAALYGALYAAAVRGLIATLKQPSARFKCRFPIDLRDELTTPSGPIDGQHLGNYLSGYEAVYDVDGRSAFWTLARGVRRDMERFMAAGGPGVAYNFIRFIKIPFVPLTRRRATLFVNSYGVVDLRDRYGSLGLEELSITFNNSGGGPSVLIHGLVIKRRLNLSLGMVDVPQEFWGRARDAIRNELQEAIHGRQNDPRAVCA